MQRVIMVFFAVLLCTGAVSAQCADTANIYSFTYNGKNYEVVKEMKTWADACSCAVERGGYLVEINDAGEQNAVYDAIINGASVSTTYTSVANGGGIAYVWIGATDQQTEGTWLWDGDNDGVGINFWNGQGTAGAGNGSAVGGAYNNWGGSSTSSPKEPDNYGSGQDHGAIALAGWPAGTTMLGVAGEWNDIIGSSSLYFVIEYDPGTSYIKMQAPKTNISVYPNPTDDIIIIQTESYIESVEIFSLPGELIYKGNDNKIDITSFNKGVYLIRINAGNSYHYQKIILK